MPGCFRNDRINVRSICLPAAAHLERVHYRYTPTKILLLSAALRATEGATFVSLKSGYPGTLTVGKYPNTRPPNWQHPAGRVEPQGLKLSRTRPPAGEHL